MLCTSKSRVCLRRSTLSRFFKLHALASVLGEESLLNHVVDILAHTRRFVGRNVVDINPIVMGNNPMVKSRFSAYYFPVRLKRLLMPKIAFVIV